MTTGKKAMIGGMSAVVIATAGVISIPFAMSATSAEVIKTEDGQQLNINVDINAEDLGLSLPEMSTKHHEEITLNNYERYLQVKLTSTAVGKDDFYTSSSMDMDCYFDVTFSFKKGTEKLEDVVLAYNGYSKHTFSTNNVVLDSVSGFVEYWF